MKIFASRSQIGQHHEVDILSRISEISSQFTRPSCRCSFAPLWNGKLTNFGWHHLPPALFGNEKSTNSRRNGSESKVRAVARNGGVASCRYNKTIQDITVWHTLCIRCAFSVWRTKSGVYHICILLWRCSGAIYGDHEPATFSPNGKFGREGRSWGKRNYVRRLNKNEKWGFPFDRRSLLYSNGRVGSGNAIAAPFLSCITSAAFHIQFVDPQSPTCVDAFDFWSTAEKMIPEMTQAMLWTTACSAKVRVGFRGPFWERNSKIFQVFGLFSSFFSAHELRNLGKKCSFSKVF